MSRDLRVTPEGESSETAGPGRPIVLVQLITTAALALSTLVAVTAVSIGFARADTPGVNADAGGAPLAIAVFIGLLLAGMGGLTALMAHQPRD